MIDIDWFKNYNDHYGHQAGDDCLRKVADMLAATIVRSGDLVARYGGEEFVFIAPATGAQDALGMARKVCEALQALALPHALSGFACVTASVGVAIYPDDGRDVAGLLNYRAQAAGQRAHPTDEHLLPLFTALGAAGADAQPEAFFRGISDHVIAMDGYTFH